MRKMHRLAQGLRKVQVEPGVVVATQNFKKWPFNFVYRRGGNIWHLWFVFSCPLRERGKKKNVWHLESISSAWGPLAFLPATLSIPCIYVNIWYLFFSLWCTSLWASLVAQLVKNPSAMYETWVLSLIWEDPLEKGKATHSSILA